MNSSQFTLPGSYKKWTWGLVAVGVIAVLYGLIMYHPFSPISHDAKHEAIVTATSGTRFWAVLLQNCTFWLLVVNAAMFFICVTTMAMGGWVIAFRRVSEAISSVVPILGVLGGLIILAIYYGGRDDIYSWLNKDYVADSKPLSGKVGFLHLLPYWTVITIALWSFLGWKMRKISLDSDKEGPMEYTKGTKWIFKNTVWASLFVVFFALTVASTLPWFWLMSIDGKWYSTMYSWYTFASTFVSGVSLIAIFVIWLKNRGQLPYVTEEHLHDLGKFMFAFSVFWTYLWFSQYMLIWYSNQPEETGYFKIRVQGPYAGIFFLNLILNFLCPLLILMRRGTKRNWTMVTFMAVLIIFGHWLDFFQMVMPGTMKEHYQMTGFEFGVPCLFIGLIMWGVGRYLTKHSMLAKNHPFLKESMIHHT